MIADHPFRAGDRRPLSVAPRSARHAWPPQLTRIAYCCSIFAASRTAPQRTYSALWSSRKPSEVEPAAMAPAFAMRSLTTSSDDIVQGFIEFLDNGLRCPSRRDEAVPGGDFVIGQPARLYRGRRRWNRFQGRAIANVMCTTRVYQSGSTKLLFHQQLHDSNDLSKDWRRGRDSNPRYGCPYAAFRVRCIQPLCHLSGAQNGPKTARLDGAM
jgi:hypothetical protein